MPVYEYECPKHGRYEVSQRITEAALTKCTIEACGEPIRKLISSTSFALKGGGWYATDYGRSGSAGTKAETKSDSAETKSETKSDAKPAASGCGSGACATGCAGVAQA